MQKEKKKFSVLVKLDILCTVLWTVCFLINLAELIDGNIGRFPLMCMNLFCAICWGISAVLNYKNDT